MAAKNANKENNEMGVPNEHYQIIPSNSTFVINAKNYIRCIKEKYKNDYVFTRPTPVGEKQTGNRYELKTVDERKVGYCIIYTGTEPIPLDTRSRNIRYRDTFSVSWLGIDEGFLGQGLGTELLLYGICDLYIKHPEVTYIILDDDTSGVHDPLSPNHIYRRIGFQRRDDLVELVNETKSIIVIQTDNPNQVKTVSGPEVVATIQHMIGAIVAKMLKKMRCVQKGGSRRRRLTRRRRHPKNTRLTRLTRLAKNTRR